MSYVPFRDSPDLAGLPKDAHDRLVPLGDLIDESHGRSYHQSECACTDPECRILRDALLGSMPSTEVVLGFLAAKGLLDLHAAERFAVEGSVRQEADGNVASDEAVTAAARAAYEREARRNGIEEPWDDLGVEQRTYLEDARAGLTAALPHLSANTSDMTARREVEIADSLKALVRMLRKGGIFPPRAQEVLDDVDKFADALRGEQA